MIFAQVELATVATVTWGNTEITKASYTDSGYTAFSASGPDGFLANAEHDEDGIVLSAIGARCGKCFLASGKWTAIKNTITITRNAHEAVDFRFLFYFLNRDGIWPSQGGGQPFISLGSARAVRIPLPPLSEQRRIAGILDQADAVRRKRQQALALTDQFLRATFLDMFGDPVTNPKHWPVVRLDAVSNIQSGVTKGRNYKGQKTVAVPYMRVANVQDGHLVLDEVKDIEVLPEEVDRFRLLPGDVLLTEGGDFDKLGRGAVWQGEIETCIHQNHIFRVRPNPESAIPEFLSTLLGSSRGKRYFLSAAKQTTGIASINKTQLSAFPSLMPPIKLQVQFRKIVRSHEKYVARFEQHASKLDLLFNTLVQRAFRGEI